MADSDRFIQVPADGSGKRVFHEPETVDGSAVHVPVVRIADKDDPTLQAPVSSTLGVAVEVKASTLPSGAATSSAQTTGNASLSSIDAKLPSLVSSRVPVDGSGVTQPVSGPLTDTELRASAVPVSAATLPLPSGAATSSAQATGNASLSSIDGKVPALGQALAAASVPVVLTAAQVSTLTPPAAITGFATAAKQDTAQTTLSSVDGKLPNLVSSRVPVDGSGVTQPVGGDVAHDGVDAGNPVKIGAVAVAFGASPAAVAASDRTNLLANRHGIVFSLGGHPNVITRRDNYTSSQTDTALVSVSAGSKMVVTRVSVLASNANSVDVSVRIGFGTANTPTGAGVVLSHPGVAKGSGVVEGSGGAVLGVGADDEELRITCGAPTGGSIDVVTTYFIIES